MPNFFVQLIRSRLFQLLGSSCFESWHNITEMAGSVELQHQTSNVQHLEFVDGYGYKLVELGTSFLVRKAFITW